jgi:hypothetical protein
MIEARVAMAILLADVVLLVHVGYAAFVIGGLLVVPLGSRLTWRWVRAPSFRIAHVLCTALIAVEALIGMVCPLTWLEHVLLVAGGAAGYDRSFIGHLLSWLLYYEAPTWMFTVAYTVLALTVVLLYHYVPPSSRLSRQQP